VDTRAITRRLREDGSLIGVLSTDQSQTDNELLEMAQKWKIVGMLKLHQSAMSLKEVTFFFFYAHFSIYLQFSTDEPK
jgi:carbamoylphosphate synthase small subunit